MFFGIDRQICLFSLVLRFCLILIQPYGFPACFHSSCYIAGVAVAYHKKTLGSLAGITGIPAKTTADSMGEKIEQEMLVFSGFDSEVLEAFLELYRTQGIEKIDYKATVTMHNVFWTPEMLYQELKKEHAAMTKK